MFEIWLLHMRANNNIFKLLREKGAEAARAADRGLILQPGAIGDCILTLPLAQFMKDGLGLGGVDILGHTEYIGILPGRTCVDGIRSIDSVDSHRLFVETEAFDLADGDPLISVFADYTWIVSFLGEPGSAFEQNLIFTANCSRSAAVIILSMKLPEEFSAHIADFYTRQFIDQSGLSLGPWQMRSNDVLIKTTEADVERGKELLKEADFDFSESLVIIQPGSGGPHKCWYLDNFLTLARELDSKGVRVIFLLGPAELERFGDAAIREMGEIARCLSDLSLTEVLGLLSCADGFVGNDSGITHLAAGLGVRTLAVFGPTDPVVYRPIGPAVTVFASSEADFASQPSERLQQELLDVLMA